jgi:CHAD domain-containing protein
MSNDLLTPDGVTLESAGETLLARIDVREGPAREADRTYFDTFDGLLHAAGVSVVHQDGRLALVERDSGAERAWVASALPAEPLESSKLDPGPMRDALAEVIEVRALLPLVHVHSRTRALDVLDGEHKTVVRMTLEEPALVASTSLHVGLRPRLRLTPVRGYADELVRVRLRLERELGFKVADQPLVDEAVRARGGVPGGTSSKIDVPLDYQQRADRAAVAVLARLLDVMRANVEGTIADIDSEFLHDFRVSVRRSRAVQRELGRVFPPDELARFRAEFRWLQQATGDARDLDVYVLEFDEYRELVPDGMRVDLEPLLGVLRSRRLIARREMARALRSERAETLLSDWRSFLDRLPELPEEDRPDASAPIGEVSGRRIAKVYRRMVRMGDAIDGASPAEDYHELRKKGKELRYLLELFGAPLYPSEVVKPMIKALKALQDVLGRHQDREVQVGVLGSLRDEVSSLPGGPAALMAMGILVERLYEDERAARDEFAERFAAFASKSQRKLVRETFA